MRNSALTDSYVSLARTDSSMKPSTPALKATRPSEEVANVLQQRTVRLQPALPTQLVERDGAIKPNRARQISLSIPSPMPASVTKAPISDKQDSETEGDNWDEDFVDDIPATRIAALDQATEQYDSFGTDDNSRTLKPPPRLTARKVSSETKPMQAIEEDFSDIIVDEKAFKGRVASLRTANTSSRKILHPRDLSNDSSTFGSGTVRALGSEKTIRPSIPSSMSMPSLREVDQKPSPSFAASASTSRATSPFAKPSPLASQTHLRPSLPTSSSISSIDKYSEANEDTEDFSDLIGKDTNGQSSSKSELLVNFLHADV